MDETSVKINNGSIRLFVPIRTQEVVVDAHRNSKECFTAIGTISVSERKPLIIFN